MLPSDDWRVQVDFQDDGPLDAIQDRLDAKELEHDLSEAFKDRVIVSRNGATIFLYAGDKAQAERAQALVERLCREDEEEVATDFRRWHPVAEVWKPAEEPLPDEPHEERAERQEAVERELKETEERGYPEFEVRVDLPSRAEAERLAELLRAEGHPVVNRWKFLLIGAVDEEQARELAERLRNEGPPGSRAVAQGTWKAAYGLVFGPFARLEASL